MTWFREIWRSKLKFGLLAVAVGLLFFLLLFVNTLSSTLLDTFIGAIENNSAQVLVFDADSQATIAASRVSSEDVQLVAAIEGVARAAPISELAIGTRFEGQDLDVSLWGIEPGGPGTPSDLEEGRVPEPGEVLVDTSARETGLTIGTVVDVADTSLVVVGVAANATYSVRPTLYVGVDTWEEVFLTTYPEAPEAPINLIGVTLAEGADSADVTLAISAIEGLQGLTRAEAASATPGVSSIEQSFGLITGITFLIVIVVVGFFFQILTVQKLGVFALLEALGSSARSMVGYILGQIGVLVFLGVVVGVALLAGAALATREIFAITIDPVLTAAVGGTVLVASLLSGVTSIRRILRQDAAGVATGTHQ